MEQRTGYLARADTARGLALLIAGAAMVVLHWILPPLAPLAVAAYGAYQVFRARFGEGAVAIVVCIGLWYTRPLVGWLLWIVGAVFVLAGLFYLIQSWREPE